MRCPILVLSYLSIVTALAHPRLDPKESEIAPAGVNIPLEDDDFAKPDVENIKVFEDFLNEEYALRGDEGYLYEIVDKYLSKKDHGCIGENGKDYLSKRNLPLRQDNQGKLLLGEENLHKRDENYLDYLKDNYPCDRDHDYIDDLLNSDDYYAFENDEPVNPNTHYPSQRDKSYLDEHGYPADRHSPKRRNYCLDKGEDEIDCECPEPMEYSDTCGSCDIQNYSYYPPQREQKAHCGHMKDSELDLQRIYLDYYRIEGDKYLRGRDEEFAKEIEDTRFYARHGSLSYEMCKDEDGTHWTRSVDKAHKRSAPYLTEEEIKFGYQFPVRSSVFCETKEDSPTAGEFLQIANNLLKRTDQDCSPANGMLDGTGNAKIEIQRYIGHASFFLCEEVRLWMLSIHMRCNKEINGVWRVGGLAIIMPQVSGWWHEVATVHVL